MEVYLQAFVNFEENDSAKLLPIAKFAYNNAINTSINHMPFELNGTFHFQASYNKDIDPCSWSKSIDEQLSKL